MEKSLVRIFGHKIIVLQFLISLNLICHAQRISMSNGSVLYICDDSTISAIGNNYGYRLGDGTNIERHIPVKVKGIQSAIDVDATGSLALLSDGSLWQWSRYGNYKLNKLPINNVKQISVGYQAKGDLADIGSFFYCAIKNDGSLWLWGDSIELNDRAFGFKDSFVKINVPKIKKVKAGNNCMIALDSIGEIWILGNLGDGEIFTALRLDIPVRAIDIAAGHQTVFALLEDSTIFEYGVYDHAFIRSTSDIKSIFAERMTYQGCFIINSEGELSQIYHLLQPIMASFNQIENIALEVDDEFLLKSCYYVIKEDGSIWRWGDNTYGQLGNFTTFSTDSPELMPKPCLAVDCDTITLNPDLLKLDTIVQPGEYVKLQTSQSEADLYWWYPRSNIISGMYNQEATVSITDDTEFSAVIMDTYGCMRKERFFLRKKCDPNIKSFSDTSAYLGTKIVLVADLGSFYSWTPSINLSCSDCKQTTATVRDSITYFVSYVDSFKCITKEQFNIKIRECDVSTLNNPKISMDTVTYPNSQINFILPEKKSYLWQPETGLSCSDCSNSIATVTDSAVYIVSLIDSFNCISKEKFIIRIRNCDTIQLNEQIVRLDTILHYPAEIQLNASESFNGYNWFDRTYNSVNKLSCLICQSPILTADATSSYVVEVSDRWRCPYKEEFKITLNMIDVVIPNVFSPNGDGINDYFEIIGLIPGTDLKIFDNNGVLVFGASNYEGNWDGNDNKGSQLNEGTYWYVIDIPYYETYKGWVYLKR